MKERIGITGSKGTIGSVLREGMRESYDITSIDRPAVDVRDFEQLRPKLAGLSAIIHLAWDTERDNFLTNDLNPDDLQMFFNVYKGALATGVKRVIMASSVHADRYDNWNNSEFKSSNDTPHPDSPYGAMKVGMEALGRYFAYQGLEVVCVRFGGVNPENTPPETPARERAVWFSHSDCVSLVDAILQAPTVPDNFAIVYGVSNNPGSIHDTSNPFGWSSKDSAPET